MIRCHHLIKTFYTDPEGGAIAKSPTAREFF